MSKSLNHVEFLRLDEARDQILYYNKPFYYRGRKSGNMVYCNNTTPEEKSKFIQAIGFVSAKELADPANRSREYRVNTGAVVFTEKFLKDKLTQVLNQLVAGSSGTTYNEFQSEGDIQNLLNGLMVPLASTAPITQSCSAIFGAIHLKEGIWVDLEIGDSNYGLRHIEMKRQAILSEWDRQKKDGPCPFLNCRQVYDQIAAVLVNGSIKKLTNKGNPGYCYSIGDMEVYVVQQHTAYLGDNYVLTSAFNRDDKYLSLNYKKK